MIDLDLVRKHEIDDLYGIGEISYSIGHIYPDWDVFIQKYVILTTLDSDLGYIYLSSFEVFLKNSAIPQNFSSYNSKYKELLWNEIFQVKNYHFNRYQPAIVLHEVKSEVSFQTRFNLYKERLTSSLYSIYSQKPNLILAVRNDVVYPGTSP